LNKDKKFSIEKIIKLFISDTYNTFDRDVKHVFQNKFDYISEFVIDNNFRIKNIETTNSNLLISIHDNKVIFEDELFKMYLNLKCEFIDNKYSFNPGYTIQPKDFLYSKSFLKLSLIVNLYLI
jgi:hypothetical protein